MNKRRLFILSFSIVCVVIIAVGLLYWFSELVVEKKLQDYIERLEKRGYTVEEHSLSDFHVDDSVRIRKFSDFTQGASFENKEYIYFDRKIHALYFLSPIQGDGIEAIVFYYKWKFL